MSRRMNLAGFSVATMRDLFGSKDEVAVGRIAGQFASRVPHRPDDLTRQVAGIVERAIMTGVPFADLGEESTAHAIAAAALASDGQDWLFTRADTYHASALEEGLWGLARKLGSPPTRAFLRGLIEGVPLFGSNSSPEAPYAAIGLEKLRTFRPGLVDLREQVTYRVGRKNSPTEEEPAAVEFAGEFVGWLDEILDAERDLWFTFG